MQKITPFLWFDNNAEEAANFYVSILDDSKVGNITCYTKAAAEASGRKEGSAMTVPFQVSGMNFVALNGGPVFKINPSISFFLNFDPSKEKNVKETLDKVWEELSNGGTTLMPLDKYPFSERYGWIQDKYGVSWQLILTNPDGEERPFIAPSLMFVGNVAGKAEEATDFYLSIFSGRTGNSKRGIVARYPAGMEPDKEGTLMFTDFMLTDQWFAAMDSAQSHKFSFNEAVSFAVNCEGQEEIDYYWDKLSDGGDAKAQQCGWLKDKFGLSWQIVPSNIGELLSNKDPQKAQRAMTAILQMKKLDIEKLKNA